MAERKANIESVLGKIAKLRALAERGGTQHEAEAAAAAMAKLLLRHNLTLGDVERHAQATNRKVTHETFDMRSNRWRIDLMFIVAQAHLCEALYVNKTNIGGRCKMLIIGHDHNLIVVRETFTWLEREGLRLSNEAYRTAKAAGDPEALRSQASWQRAFRFGFAYGIEAAYAAMKEEVKAEAGADQWALVPVLEHEVQRYIEDRLGQSGNLGAAQKVAASPYDLGMAVGKGMNLGKQVGHTAPVGALA